MSQDLEVQQQFQTPTIEIGVPGLRGEDGFVLRAPWREELIWDLDMEVVAVRRRWLADSGGWWIAASYFQSVVNIVLRTFPSVLVLGPDEDRLLSRDGRDALQGRLL